MHRPSFRILPLIASTFALAGLAAAAAAAITPIYVLEWGTQGTVSGQFDRPTGVAVDESNGDVFVVDSGNHRVQKFSGNGTYLTQWGSLGFGNGQFNDPFGIVVARGFVYVVDAGNNRLQKFTTSGAYVTQWGTTGTGNGQFQQPRCVALDPGGDVYVTDFALNRVQKFTDMGAYITQWGTTGAGNGQFNGLSGVAVSGGGDIFVTDAGNQRVQLFTSAGFFLAQWGTAGAGNGQFANPCGIAFAVGGSDVYLVFTFNDRVQILSTAGAYDTQWGATGTGNAQFDRPHAAAIDGLFIYVADTENHRIQKFGPPTDGPCPTCFSPPDQCCATFPQVGGPWSNILVGTRQPSPGYPYSVTLFDLASSPVPAEGANWASMNRYNGPGNSWVGDSLGTVFGITLDKYGNIFAGHSSCYNDDAIGQVFGGAAGAIYRIDGNTGAINTFCVLPNLADPGVALGANLPGLGNITYDCQHEQFFVTNLEDGKIYRIQPAGVNGPTGTVVETFDPLAPDDGTPGWAPLGERLWAVQWHGDRVYYGVWAMDSDGAVNLNEVRSVGLLPSGAFAPGTDQHELYLQPVSGGSGGGGPRSYPVADISFSESGRMLLGERGISGKSYSSPHQARVLEFECSGGCWLPGNTYEIGTLGSPAINAEGGVDYDRLTFNGPGGAVGRVWASADANFVGPDAVYGYQGLRPNLALGSYLTSKLVDSDGVVSGGGGDKMYVGDIEAIGCPFTEIGTICGRKFEDTNRNSVQDPGEPGLPGWTIQLTGPSGPYTATTDANGNYCITNVLLGTYTLAELGLPAWMQTAPVGGAYSVTIAPGQTLYGYNFGNHACDSGIGCVQPPSGMGAWWPFNEPAGSVTASDVTHMSPPRNIAQLFGGAGITGLSKVKQGLCFNTTLDYARVPNSNQLGINFAAGSFAIDAWVKLAPVGNASRIVVEKRELLSNSPYRTRGWALYLNGLQSQLEIGNGLTTQIVSGPSVISGAWSHLAVSVDRSTGQGRWYLNGSPAGAFDFVPIPGSVFSNADVYMGYASPPFGGAVGFGGCIDELELFMAPLSAATVSQIYAAGAGGKCPEFLLVPRVTAICNTQTSVQVCFTICNTQPTPQSYTWSMLGLPSGPGCTVNGPAGFSPSSGTVVVPGGACSPPICVTVPRPPGLVTQNATSCYAVSFVNDSTGRCRTVNATIRADYGCWCVTQVPSGVVPVLARAAPTGIAIGIKNPCGTPAQLSYRLSALWLNTEHEDPHALSLNGLPPGEPVLGTLTYGPGEETQIAVDVSYPNGYDPAAPYEIVLEAEAGTTGGLELLTGVLVMAAYDSIETVGVPGSGPRVGLQLVSSPNPFIGGSVIGFALAGPDDIELGVYDLGGRQVRSLHRGRLAAGPHQFEWNGRDDRGRRAPAGIYFLLLDVSDRRLAAKLVKLQ